MAETSNVRLARLLTLVPWLTAHSGVSKAAAAAHFGLTIEQLESDLELITFTGPGLYGGELVDIYFDDETITVYDSQGFDRPLQLTADEIATLLVGLRALQQLPDVDAATVASCIEKLSTDGHSASDLMVNVTTPNAASIVAEAIRENRDLEIEYLHPLRDDTTLRTITPLRLFSATGADYVEAWCHTAEAHRTFRIDRMLTCIPGGPRTTVPTPAPSTLAHELARVSVQPWAQHVLEGVPATVEIGDEVIRAEIAYADERWLVQWAITAGRGVAVTTPPHVQPLARQHADAALLTYAAV